MGESIFLLGIGAQLGEFLVFLRVPALALVFIQAPVDVLLEVVIRDFELRVFLFDECFCIIIELRIVPNTFNEISYLPAAL